jgi:hypothetical protein
MRSVTPSIGARIENGVFSLSQNIHRYYSIKEKTPTSYDVGVQREGVRAKGGKFRKVRPSGAG